MSATDTALAVNRAQAKMIQVRDSRIAALESELSASRAQVATLREALGRIARDCGEDANSITDNKREWKTEYTHWHSVACLERASAAARAALASTEPKPERGER